MVQYRSDLGNSNGDSGLGLDAPRSGQSVLPHPPLGPCRGAVDCYLVRPGLKAQTVLGLLFEQDGAWRARFRPRDYALLC